VNRTSFYAWQTAEPTVPEERDAQLAPLVRVIFKRHRRRYGARRIAEDLKEMGHHCDRRKVSNVMKTLKLNAIQPKSFVPKTTDSRHRLGYSPNLLLDADAPATINQVWIGDITYIPLTDGTFCDMAMLMDLFSRRIVGWHRDGTACSQGTAFGHQRTTAGRWIASSHGSRRPVRWQRIPITSSPSSDHTKHEPC
jgi:putative transposase